MNMRKIGFWKLNHVKTIISFQLKRIFHSLLEFFWDLRYTSSVFGQVVIEAIKNLFFSGIVAFLLYKADAFFITRFCLLIDDNAFFNFLLAGLSLTGIILGLYCSNIVSIYSTVYINAPKQVSDFFYRDIVTNKSIKHIIAYIILNLIILIEHILSIAHSIISLLFMSVFIVYVITYYSITRNRSLQLSNSFSVAHIPYAIIYKSIKRVTQVSIFARDTSFQSFFQKKAERNLNILLSLAQYNISKWQNSNAAMLEFMKDNLNLLKAYWQDKPSIPFNSLWFKEKTLYKQWYMARDYEIDAALQSGTYIQPDHDSDRNWLEEKIFEINNICFSKLCEDHDYRRIYEYLFFFATAVKNAASADTISFSLQHIKLYQERIKDFYLDAKKTQSKEMEWESTLLGIIEMIVGAYINLTLGINDFTSHIDLQSLIKNTQAQIINCFEPVSSEFTFLNNAAGEKLIRCIRTELEIEKHKITPDWYIEQTLASIINSRLCEIIAVYNQIFNSYLPTFGDFFQKKQLYAEAMLIYSKMQEVLSKERNGIATLEALLPHLLNMHKEESIVWEDNQLDDFISATRKTVLTLPKHWLDCSTVFVLENWEQRKNFPDLLGFCYNNYCEYLIEAIEEYDSEKFRTIFPEFINVMLLYQEYIRTDLISIKEKYRKPTVFHVWSAPYYEYALICGLAIIIGELTSIETWKETIDQSLQSFSKAHSEKANAIYKQWCEVLIQRRHDIPGIGNRDLIETGWKSRITHSLKRNHKIEYIYSDHGQKNLKTNSRLLKSFLSDTFSDLGFYNNIEEVFFIECLNKYLPSEIKYQTRTGWERTYNGELK